MIGTAKKNLLYSIIVKTIVLIAPGTHILHLPLLYLPHESYILEQDLTQGSRKLEKGEDLKHDILTF